MDDDCELAVGTMVGALVGKATNGVGEAVVVGGIVVGMVEVGGCRIGIVGTMLVGGNAICVAKIGVGLLGSGRATSMSMNAPIPIQANRAATKIARPKR